MKAKHFGRLGGRNIIICNGRRNFGRFKKRFGNEDNEIIKVDRIEESRTRE